MLQIFDQMKAIHPLSLRNDFLHKVWKQTCWIDADNLAHEAGAIFGVRFHLGHGDDVVRHLALTDLVAILLVVILVASARLNCDNLSIVLIDVILACDKESVADESWAERFHDDQSTICRHLCF